MSWHAVKLSDVCLTITDGAHKSPPSQDSGFPMASVKDMTHWGINLENCRLISQQDFHELCLSGCQPIKGDVLIAKDGNSCLQTVCVHGATIDMVLLSSVAILRPNPDKCDSKFLQYHLTNPYTKAALKNYISGVAIPRVVLRDFKNYQFSIPSIDVQQEIGSVLSIYDDLIENNRRRIHLLEESARLLYKEWFVHLRFPGHEHVKIIDGVPEGWGEFLFADIADIRNGFAFKAKDYSTEGMPVVRTRDFSSTRYISRGEDIRIPFSLLDKYKKYQLSKYEFLLIMVGASIGKYGLVLSKDLPALQNQNMWAITTKDEKQMPQLFLVHSMEEIVRKMAAMKVGAARDFFRKGFLGSQSIIIPSKSMVAEFNEFADNVYSQIENLNIQNEKLEKARDILLPRLMNGELTI